MKCLIQRVKEATIHIENKVISHIQHGLLVFVCAEPNDTEEIVRRAVNKIIKLRIFNDTEGKMNLSLADTNGSLLIVSQFTLAADTTKGNRPSFFQAAKPDLGKKIYNDFVRIAKQMHPTVQSGKFAANMQIALVNDGPVTIPMQFD